MAKLVILTETLAAVAQKTAAYVQKANKVSQLVTNYDTAIILMKIALHANKIALVVSNIITRMTCCIEATLLKHILTEEMMINEKIISAICTLKTIRGSVENGVEIAKIASENIAETVTRLVSSYKMHVIMIPFTIMFIPMVPVITLT